MKRLEPRISIRVMVSYPPVWSKWYGRPFFMIVHDVIAIDDEIAFFDMRNGVMVGLN